jgi:hypothetical protein
MEMGYHQIKRAVLKKLLICRAGAIVWTNPSSVAVVLEFKPPQQRQSGDRLVIFKNLILSLGRSIGDITLSAHPSI